MIETENSLLVNEEKIESEKISDWTEVQNHIKKRKV